MSIPELRWCRDSPERAGDEPQPVSVREVIASLESYDPVSTLTRGALALHRGDAEVSTALLRAELARIQQSPIVLNRRLREVALATIEREALSMSEIAIRCGRVKRDCSGNESGETSWLARRLGLLPEGGRDMPTPWIHSDVLALIARCGLGISPREVELDRGVLSAPRIGRRLTSACDTGRRHAGPRGTRPWRARAARRSGEQQRRRASGSAVSPSTTTAGWRRPMRSAHTGSAWEKGVANAPSRTRSSPTERATRCRWRLWCRPAHGRWPRLATSCSASRRVMLAASIDARGRHLH